MSTSIKFPGWQVLLVRTIMPREARLTWRAGWPVMVARMYHSTDGRCRTNGFYVRLGSRMRGVCVMPWRPQPKRVVA